MGAQTGKVLAPLGVTSIRNDPNAAKKILNGEKLLWIGLATQLSGSRRREGETKIRVLIVSDAAVYKVRTEALDKVKRRIDLKSLQKVRYNLKKKTFTMECTKYDYRFKCVDCKDIIKKVDQAKLLWEERNGITRTELFCVPTAGAARTRAGLGSVSISTSTGQGSVRFQDEELLRHLASLKSMSSDEYKEGFDIDDDLANTFSQQAGNFKLCFCLAGYRMCAHVHPHFRHPPADISPERRGAVAPSASEAKEPPPKPKPKAKSSTSSPPPPPKRAKIPLSTPPIQLVTAGLKQRRRKPTSIASASASRIRNERQARCDADEAAEDKLNTEALSRLIMVTKSIQRKGITLLRSKFVRDPDAFLGRHGPLNHNRQVRKACLDHKHTRPAGKFGGGPTNPAIEDFLHSASDVKLLELAGAKLLESVYNLPRFHTEYLAHSFGGEFQGAPLAKARVLFRRLARRVESRKYDLLAEIGSGAFGSVYIARATEGGFKSLQTGTMIAVKSVDMAGDDDLEEVNKELEALTAGGVACPQLVRYFGSETVGRHLLLAMELMHGSLAELKPLPEPAVAVCARETLKGLKFLWTKYKKFHRDLKGANILYSLSGRIKLADFGCVRSFFGATLKKAYTKVGSPYWMAPEIIACEPYDQSVDVWSLGITVVELITGRVPFCHLPPGRAMAEIVRGESPRLRSVSHSTALRDFLSSCLRRNPKYRASLTQLLQSDFVRSAGALKGWLPQKAKEIEKKKRAKYRQRKSTMGLIDI